MKMLATRPTAISSALVRNTQCSAAASGTRMLARGATVSAAT
jgi:hypothetical protein